MESFSLLKYWRASTTIVAITTGGGHEELPSSTSTAISTTYASSPYSHTTTTTTVVPNEEDQLEAGSFFDLELSSFLNEQVDESDSTSESQEEAAAANHKHSFTSLSSLDAADTIHHSHASLLKSATRFRVFALGLNKKLKSGTNASATVDSPKSSSSTSSTNNFFVEVFTGSRNNSSKSKAQDSAELEKKNSKEVVQKYINTKIKPMYVRVCRRYGERFSVPLTAAAGGDPTKKKKKVVMLKSRSAVAAVTMMPPPPPAAAALQRRDDSLLQQEDGIQSAIAHCKKSFNASSSKEPETLVVDEGEERIV